MEIRARLQKQDYYLPDDGGMRASSMDTVFDDASCE